MRIGYAENCSDAQRQPVAVLVATIATLILTAPGPVLRGKWIAELAAPPASFTTDDHAWVRDRAAASLAEVEAATLRLVAIHTSRNLSHAAARLGMAPVSLSRWLGRRESPPMMLGEDTSHR